MAVGEATGSRAGETAVATAPLPIAIFVHVHYLDVWTEISGLLSKTVRTPFRLYVTTTHPEADLHLPQTQFLVSAKVASVENRGRDIRPFLLALAEAKPFEIGLKLHTKRSVHRLDGAQWRSIILSSLLEPQGGTLALIERFAADPRIAMVAPDSSFLRLAPWIMRNRRNMTSIYARLGQTLEATDVERACFAAGSMFWFKRKVLAEFADTSLRDVFEDEKGQVDGTAAHAIERLFGVAAIRQGLHVLDVSGLMASSVESDLTLLERSGLLRAATYFVRPPALVRWAGLYFPFVLPIYRNMPRGLRSVLKWSLSGPRRDP